MLLSDSHLKLAAVLLGLARVLFLPQRQIRRQSGLRSRSSPLSLLLQRRAEARSHPLRHEDARVVCVLSILIIIIGRRRSLVRHGDVPRWRVKRVTLLLVLLVLHVGLLLKMVRNRVASQRLLLWPRCRLLALLLLGLRMHDAALLRLRLRCLLLLLLRTRRSNMRLFGLRRKQPHARVVVACLRRLVVVVLLMHGS